MLTFDKKRIVGEIQVSIEITESDIENIIVTAWEGGTNYWMGLENSYPEFDNKPKDEPISTWSTKILLEGKTIHLYDKEYTNEKWELTLEKLFKGITLNKINRQNNSDLNNIDANTADCIVQYALFDDIIYG
jgi:hypothetical protein